MKKKNLYINIVVPLKAVLKEAALQPIFDELVLDMHKLVILGYQFIRLYLLDKFNNRKPFPTIDFKFILYVLKTIAVTDTTVGRPPKAELKEVRNDISSFYNNEFSKLFKEKISRKYKTYILDLIAKEMLKCIETNISTQYINHLFKYINCKFKNAESASIKLCNDKNIRKSKFKELNEDVRNLKNDLINDNIVKSKQDYHIWIGLNKKFLYPKNINKSVAYDLKIRPLEYLWHSFYVNSEIERLGGRPYQVIPQRNTNVPKSIALNTAAISEYLGMCYKGLFNFKKTELLINSKKHQNHVWSKVLKVEKNSIFRHKDYVFYNQITTDGFSCSLLFILKKFKNKTFGQIIPKNLADHGIIQKIDSLTKQECQTYLTGNYKIVALDPGVIRPISIIDEIDKFYKYSARRWRFDTYTKRSLDILKREKRNCSILEKEAILSQFKSRTFNIPDFKNFILNKQSVNRNVESFYNNVLYKKLKFRRFVKKKQSEELLLKEVKRRFLTEEDLVGNKQLLIFYGDYSRTRQMRGTVPAPSTNFKKLLSREFIILEVNEFNTSKLYNKGFQELESVVIKKKKHKKRLHEVLTLKNKSFKTVFVNRDNNACKNILLIGKQYLVNQTRPAEFCRKT
jgi:hypothetical protein